VKRRKTIYVVTAVAPPYGPTERTQSRAWAWYATLRDAKRACLGNDGDMLEYLYDYLVIERVLEGCGGVPKVEREWWFEAVYADARPPKVRACAKPKVYEQTVGFGLG
jgi:hypothetical protein